MVPTSVPASRLYPPDPPPSLRPYVVLAIVIPATSSPRAAFKLKLFSSHFSPIVTNEPSSRFRKITASSPQFSLFIRRRAIFHLRLASQLFSLPSFFFNRQASRVTTRSKHPHWMDNTFFFFLRERKSELCELCFPPLFDQSSEAISVNAMPFHGVKMSGGGRSDVVQWRVT